MYSRFPCIVRLLRAEVVHSHVQSRLHVQYVHFQHDHKRPLDRDQCDKVMNPLPPLSCPFKRSVSCVMADDGTGTKVFLWFDLRVMPCVGFLWETSCVVRHFFWEQTFDQGENAEYEHATFWNCSVRDVFEN